MTSACSSSTSIGSVVREFLTTRDLPKCIPYKREDIPYIPIGMLGIIPSVWMGETRSLSLIDRIKKPEDPELLRIQLKCTVKDGQSVVTLVHDKNDYSADAFFSFEGAKGNEATVTFTSFLSDDMADENAYHIALPEGTTTLVADSITAEVVATLPNGKKEIYAPYYD